MSTSSISLSSPLCDLYKKAGVSIKKLNQTGITTVEDLLWIIPNKVILTPTVKSFNFAQVSYLFKGKGKIVSIQAKPNFKAKGKGRAMLYNVTAVVKDSRSDQTLNLKWFNCYSSIQKKLQELDEIEFIGTVSEYNGLKQIANPEYYEPKNQDEVRELKVQYPTISGVNSINIKRIFDRIPEKTWNEITEFLPNKVLENNSFITRKEAFSYIHGRVASSEWSDEKYKKAKERLVYEEFFTDQLKVHLRKNNRKTESGITINVSDKTIKKASGLYPYQLTEDQQHAIDDIIRDFSSPSPMMRLIQGDVGCGKTTVAVLSCFYAIHEGFQTAFMCPTESLAKQHFREIINLFPKEMNVSFLLGSQSAGERKEVLAGLKDGTIKMVIGTHSLFQDSVKFKNLGLSIIDEQHKFGVEQRLKLVAKGKGSHCLIMSATPIPRSLSLTQYGDLDISIIKTMPGGRKGTQTRIVTESNFDKFLSFLHTRIEIGEQAYILVPAVNESPDQNIRDIENTLDRFKNFFPKIRIKPLHGQMKAREKEKTFIDFKNHEIDILVATSVIEVGINVINSTIMAILNPERFGLSSLHQMRGRVGRGEKPGFCFLILDRKLSPESLHRLQVIEKSTDGFKIAEEDLKIRGQGDLFGQEQSGVVTQKKIANIIEHQDILYRVIQDFKQLNLTDKEMIEIVSKLDKDQKIYTTI